MRRLSFCNFLEDDLLCGHEPDKGAAERCVVVSNDRLGAQVWRIHTAVSICNEYRVQAHVGGDAAVGVDAVLGFQAGNKQLLNPGLLQLLGECGSAKATGPGFINQRIHGGVQLQIRVQLPEWAACGDGGVLWPGVTHGKNGDVGRACFCNQRIDVVEQLFCAPWAFWPVKQANLHVDDE